MYVLKKRYNKFTSVSLECKLIYWTFNPLRAAFEQLPRSLFMQLKLLGSLRVHNEGTNKIVEPT